MSVLILATSVAVDDAEPADPEEPSPLFASSAATSGTSWAISADSGRLVGAVRPAAMTWLARAIAVTHAMTATKGRKRERVPNARVIDGSSKRDREVLAGEGHRAGGS